MSRSADIIFTTENDNIKVPGFRRRVITNWIREVAELKGKRIGEITYVFCDDRFIRRLNKKSLNHDYETDILTFDNCVDDLLFADIVISLETIDSNATIFGEPSYRELLRVMIHGVLHLCGYRDATEEEQETMRQEEDAALALLPEKYEEIWTKRS
ncbi:rRNA maturation RNase YbeY [Porphyromonas sp. COT-108 OH1349]|uniref:rRNA maturation RNase YbeY n=1 Tax=Porphyromonas sp. COT-108 OH1349 TaxID=1537504 RepID=UPI00068B1837|nr:rRNA maturation RNase YbeY [Porphyromonas sp. COT-108 OH1349]